MGCPKARIESAWSGVKCTNHLATVCLPQFVLQVLPFMKHLPDVFSFKISKKPKCLYHYLVPVGLIQLSLHSSLNYDFHNIELIHKGVPTLLPFSVILRLRYWYKLYTVGKNQKSVKDMNENYTFSGIFNVIQGVIILVLVTLNWPGLHFVLYPNLKLLNAITPWVVLQLIQL